MNSEALIIQYLAGELDVPVSAQVPATRPEAFVTVERVGGPINALYDWPNVAVQAWGPSRAQAAALMDTVRDTLLQITVLPVVADVSVGSTYNWPDPDSQQSRYQTVATLTVVRDGAGE